MWPSHGINVSNAIKKSLPPQTSWKSFSYKYLIGPFDSYEDAKSKEKDAEFVSSDDAKLVTLLNKTALPLKRSRKPKNFNDHYLESPDVDTSDVESTDSSISEETLNNSKKKDVGNTIPLKQDKKKKIQKVIPSPPSNFEIIKSNENCNQDQKETESNEKEKSTQSSPVYNIYESQSLDYGSTFVEEESLQCEKNQQSRNYQQKQSGPVIKNIDCNPAHCNLSHLKSKKGIKYGSLVKGKSYSALQIQKSKSVHVSNTINRDNLTLPDETSNQTFDETPNETPDEMSDETSNKTPDETNISERKNKKEKNLTEKQYSITQEKYSKTIIEKLDVVNRKLDLILAYHNEQIPFTNDFLNLLPHFPLNSMEEFKKFCEDLNRHEELRTQFQKEVRIMGGKSAENHLRNCLVATLTNKLAKNLTWEGQHQTEGIKNTAFANIILGIILNMHSSSANMYSLRNKFSEWLRRAGDRYRYELKKQSE